MPVVVWKRSYDLGNGRTLFVVRRGKEKIVLFSIVRGANSTRYQSRTTFALNASEAQDLARFIAGISIMGKLETEDSDESEEVTEPG